MRVLVTGAESSGTKLVASLLRSAGGEVVHSSPMYRAVHHDGRGFDAVVLVVRHGPCRDRSAVGNGHASDRVAARGLGVAGIGNILLNLTCGPSMMHICTYEALIHEPGALPALCRDLGLSAKFEHEEIGDANAKWYGGSYFSDDRPLQERGSS